LYHFSTVYFPYSRSYIALLENGTIRIFDSINCKDGDDDLEGVVTYLDQKLESVENKDEILTRLNNYRRYGVYRTVDWLGVVCAEGKEIPENSDTMYNRSKVLNQLSDVLRVSVSTNVKKHYSPFFVEESRAIGFFVYDLTDPSNRQTSLLERIQFKDHHVYHFAYIDAPFSFSNIVFLENGTLKIFRAINCDGKGETLEDVIAFLKEKLKDRKDRDETIKRVKDYRQYGVYAKFEGMSVPQCEEVILFQK
jgi:hypothetical protein